jgi:large subunit ribosomal protein L24
MKIRKGDKVIVIAGKDKGKTGAVAKAIPRLDKVVVDGINISKKSIKSRVQGQPGQKMEKAMPIHVSNVALIDPKTKKATRVRMERDSKGNIKRVATKSGSVIK